MIILKNLLTPFSAWFPREIEGNWVVLKSIFPSFPSWTEIHDHHHGFYEKDQKKFNVSSKKDLFPCPNPAKNYEQDNP